MLLLLDTTFALITCVPPVGFTTAFTTVAFTTVAFITVAAGTYRVVGVKRKERRESEKREVRREWGEERRTSHHLTCHV